MNTNVTKLISAEVDRDISNGTVRASRRLATIERRSNKLCITVVRQNGRLWIGLAYGYATNGSNHYCAVGESAPVAVHHSLVNGQFTLVNAAFAAWAIRDIQSRYGPLAVRFNCYAQPLREMLRN